MPTPLIRPTYPEPPWEYVNASVLNVVTTVQHPERLRDFVDDGIEPRRGGDKVIFFFLDVPGIPVFGPDYHSTECGMIVPAQTPGGLTGGHFSFMLVDNDRALAAGREIWGYPKKLAQVHMRRVGDDEIVARATHHPYRGWSGGGVMEVRARLDGSAEHLSAELEALEPRLLSKVVRSPESGRPERTAVMKVHNQVTRVHERASGTASLELGSSREEGLGALGEIEVLGALFTRCDFRLDYGAPLAEQARTAPAGASEA